MTQLPAIFIPDSQRSIADQALEDLAPDQLFDLAATWARSRVGAPRGAADISTLYFSPPGGAPQFMGWWTPFMGGVFLPSGRR